MLKNSLGGSVINVGSSLPPATPTKSPALGALHLLTNTAGVPQGAYVYGFRRDNAVGPTEDGVVDWFLAFTGDGGPVVPPTGDYEFGGTMLGPLHILTNDVPQLVLENPDNSTISMIRFKSPASSVYAGHGASNTFAIKGDAVLNTAPWFSVSATTGSVLGALTGDAFVFTTLSMPDGLQTAPGLSFTTDSGTGIHTIGANTINITTGGTIAATIDASGNLSVTGLATAMSDARLKEDLQRIENAGEKIAALTGYTYRKLFNDQVETGVLAQQVAEVLPEIVSENSDGILSVSYDALIAVLVQALNEEQQALLAVEKRINTLVEA